MPQSEYREPRFMELDQLIESRGERVHRLEPGGVMRSEMNRIRKRRERIERRQKYLQEFSWMVFLDPKVGSGCHADSPIPPVDAPKDPK